MLWKRFRQTNRPTDWPTNWLTNRPTDQQTNQRPTDRQELKRLSITALWMWKTATLNIVLAQTAAQQQCNGSYEARMSGKCGEWRDYFIMTVFPIHWVPGQDKGSKTLCVKLGAMKVISSDPLHQEYLTINLRSTSDWRQLKLPLVRLFGRWRGRCCPGGAACGRECRRRSSVLQTLLQPVRMAYP